jgi:triosephosphate isomerase
VAYEPVWAISTFDGEIAKPTDIEPVFKLIHGIVAELYGVTAANDVRLLYGGSVTADTAGSYLALPSCDGALIGGASLNYQQFASIVDAAYRVRHQEAAA